MEDSGSGAIPQLEIDVRPIIMDAYNDCIAYRIDYNTTVAMQPEQGQLFKAKFYKRFLTIYYYAKPAFESKLIKDDRPTEVALLLKDIERWVRDMEREPNPNKILREKGFGYLDKFEPHLRRRNLIWKPEDIQQ